MYLFKSICYYNLFKIAEALVVGEYRQKSLENTSISPRQTFSDITASLNNYGGKFVFQNKKWLIFRHWLNILPPPSLSDIHILYVDIFSSKKIWPGLSPPIYLLKVSKYLKNLYY